MQKSNIMQTARMHSIDSSSSFWGVNALALHLEYLSHAVQYMTSI